MSPRRAWPVLGLVTFLALSAVPASAEHGGYGDVVTVASPEVALSLKTTGSAAICFVDNDGNGGYGLGDPTILSINNGCTGNSDGGDIRIATWGENLAGRRLGVSPDVGRPLATPPGGTVSFYYYDANGNGRMDAGDTAYANVKNPTTSFVDVADVRLSAFGDAAAGEQVRQGDVDMGLTLRVLGAPGTALGYVDINDNNAFDNIDIAYLNSDLGGAETVEFGDLRLLPVADDRPFGTFVAPGHADGDMLLVSVSRRLCYADTDASGGYNGGDPLFFDLSGDCVGNVQPSDIRLTTTGDGAAGTRVGAADDDFGLGLGALPSAEVSFIDNDGDLRFTRGDVFFLDVVDPTSRAVHAGDVRLTPAADGGGRPMASGDPLVGSRLISLGAFQTRIGFIPYGGGSTPGADDPVYVNIDGASAEGVEPNDVRLVALGDLPFGAGAQLSDGDVLASLRAVSGSVCFTASSGSAYRAGDPLYLSFSGGCSGTVHSNTMRLVAAAGHAAGSAVRTTDSDHGGTILSAGAVSFEYFDADGDSEWSTGDTLYIDLVSDTSDRVDVGDLRVSDGARPGGVTVTASDSDRTLPLRSLGAVSARTSYVDGNGDGVFGPSDTAYVDADGDAGFVTVLDVRLTPLPPSTAMPTEPEEPTGEGPSEPTDGQDPTGPTDGEGPTPSTPTDGGGPTPGTPTDDGAGDEDGGSGKKKVRSPSVAPALVVAMALLFAAWHRRRS